MRSLESFIYNAHGRLSISYLPFQIEQVLFTVCIDLCVDVKIFSLINQLIVTLMKQL